MVPQSFITRAELEERLDQMRSDFQAAQLHQDEQWNKGFVALREAQTRGFETLTSSLRLDIQTAADSLKELFIAKLDPVKAIAYGSLVLLLGVTAWFAEAFAQSSHLVK